MSEHEPRLRTLAASLAVDVPLSAKAMLFQIGAFGDILDNEHDERD